MTDARKALADRLDELRKTGMGYDERENPVTYEEFLAAHHDDFTTALRSLAGTQDREEVARECECGFSAEACSTNPCYRKKIHLAGLTPGSKWPYQGEPTEPARITDEMIRAGRTAHHKHGCGAVREIFTAMLAALPPAPMPERGDKPYPQSGHDAFGRRVDPAPMPEALKDTIATCYGLLWEVGTENQRVHRARLGLLQWLTKDEQARGIEMARGVALMVGLPPNPELEALKNAHVEIVLTIAFLARDITTERLSKTIEHLTTRLVAVDKVCRAALAPHDKTEG